MKEYNAAKYVQNKMSNQNINAVRDEEPVFTKDDLQKAYMAGWDDAIRYMRRDYSDRTKGFGNIIKR